MTRIAAALAALALAAFSPPQDKLELLILTGSHRHDWYNTTPILVKFLRDSGRFNVTVSEDPVKVLTPEGLKKYGVVLLHYRETSAPQKFPVLDDKYVPTKETKEFPPKPGRWPAENEKALLDAVSGGTGLVVIHFATSAFDEPKEVNWPEYEKLIGGGWRRSKGNFGHGTQFQFEVKIANKEHPITKGFPDKFLHSKDELYHKSLMVEGNTVLLTGFDDPAKGGKACTGKDENLGWVREHGKGRVFTTVLGHGYDQMRLSPGFQALVSRGAEWAATGKVTLPLPSKIDADPAP
jgi:type 1 glutamine amidotransferase